MTRVKTTNLWQPVKRLQTIIQYMYQASCLYICGKHNGYLQRRLFSSIRCKSWWNIATFSSIYRKNGIIISACFSQSRRNCIQTIRCWKEGNASFQRRRGYENPFQHVRKVLDTDTYEQAVKKITDGLSEWTKKVVQRNSQIFPKGQNLSKSGSRK